MKILLGLLIIAIGSIGQASSYVPINKVKNWSWECFWLTQGIFAWLVFPFAGTLLALPEGVSLLELWQAGGALKSVAFGVAYGIGGLTFGLTLRYLGVALGQSIALSICAAFGTLIPVLLAGDGNLFEGEGLIVLIGVSIAIAGVAVIGYAGSLRNKNMSEEAKKAAIKDFALTKGLLMALIAGVMSACFALGLDAGKEIENFALEQGVNKLFAGLPIIFLVTSGAFITNAVYCLSQNVKNKSFKDYTSVSRTALANNILFCALAGLCWYSQFFGLAMGKSFLADSAVLLAFSWSILMSLNVLFSNVWGIILKEWKGAGRKAAALLVVGLLILIFSIIYPQL
jgi:L-rhamnose-H+ transport protein